MSAGRGIRARIAVGLVSGALIGAACSSSSSPDTADEHPTNTSAEIATTTTTELVLTADQELVEVDATFQSGALLVTIGDVVYDRGAERLFAGVRLQNLSDDWVQASWDAAVEVGDQPSGLNIRGRVSWIPSGFRSDLTAEASVRGDDPLADAVIVWGRADESQTTVRLADGTVDGRRLPVDTPIDGWVQIGRHTVHVTGGRIFGDAVRAPRADTGERVLRLYFDEWASRPSPVNGFYPADHFQLSRPDGAVVEPLGGSDGWAPQSWTATTANWVDFAVPEDPAGDYDLLLASVSRHAFGLPHPGLVERQPLPFSIDKLDESAQGNPTESDGAMSVPKPILPSTDEASDLSPLHLDLDVGEVNVPGFGFAPTELTWDPAAEMATVTGVARLLPIVDPPDPEGLLTTPSQFSFRAVLASGRRLFDGQMETTGAVVEAGQPREFVYRFDGVSTLDGDDIALLLGHPRMQPSTIPLTPGAPFVVDPAVPDAAPITAEPVQTGDYTVDLITYRFGLPNELDRPPLGQRALEVIYEVTASPAADPTGFGLGFRSVSQLLIARPDGYLHQPANHSGHVTLEPGETKRMSATFYVPVTWQPGRMAFAARSTDETSDVFSTSFTEVTFAVDLHGSGDQPTLDPTTAAEDT